jgi:hypothetical protein
MDARPQSARLTKPLATRGRSIQSGQERRLRSRPVTSGVPRLADHLARPLDFALGPEAASCSADVHKLGIYLITSSARAGNAGDNYDARCIRLSPDADVMRSSEVFARCRKQPKTHRPAHYRVESIRFCSRGARLRSNSSSMIGRLMCSIPDSAAGSSGLLPARVSLSHCFHSSVW